MMLACGINEISGHGMLDFIYGFSLEKLVLDNEICGQVLRMTKGISPKGNFPLLPLMQELLSEGHLLISNHTQRYFQEEQHLPRNTVNRSNLSDWKTTGSKSIKERAHDKIESLLANHEEINISKETKNN